MTSSQIFIFGLVGGGFILLALLLTYLISLVLQIRRRAAIAAGQSPNAEDGNGFMARLGNLVRFNTSSNLPAHERVGWDPHQHGRLPSISNWRWPLLLFIALGIIVWAEFSLLELMQADWNADVRLPIAAFLVAGALFVLVCRKVEGPSLATRFKAIVPVGLGPRPSLWLTNLCLSIVLLSSIDRDLPSGSSYVFLALWIVNILLFCWNVLQVAHVSPPTRDEIREWWRTYRLEILLVSLIGLAALSIRIIGLETYPYAFANEEGDIGMEAWRILTGGNTSFFILNPWTGNSMLTYLPGAVLVQLLGSTALAIRLLSALQGTLAVVFVYLLAREAFGRPVGFLAACLLAAMPWHVHFSRIAVPNIADSFFSAGVLWLTYRALRHGRYTDYMLAGLMAGFTVYTYLGSRLVTAMAVVVLVYACLRQRNYLQTHFRHLVIFVLAFLVVASPMILSFSYHIDDFTGRINSEGLLANHRLEELAASASIQPLDYLIGQLQNSTMVFVARPASAQFFDSPRPYLEWWAVVFLVLGMAYTFWRIKEVRYMLLIIWFWAPVIIGGALTTFPPNNQRMLAAAPALALLVALGLWKLAHSLRVMTRLPANLFMAICMLVVISTAWQDAHFYFAGQYRTERHFEMSGNEFFYEVGTRTAALGPGYRLLVIGAPEVSAGAADLYYLAPHADAQDFNEVNPETLAGLPRDRGIFFAAIPSRVGDLKLVAQQLPGGEWLEVPHRTHEGIAYYGYILPAVSPAP
jgi:4-amino-4-deoxy-L-arabinose transferase-like glycosyltransferase